MNKKYLHLYQDPTTIYLEQNTTLDDVELIDPILTFHINNDLVYNKVAYNVVWNIAREISNRSGLTLVEDKELCE